MGHISPNVGHWYRSNEFPEIFEVVAADEIHESVEIQYFHGSIGGIDLETWHNLRFSAVTQPEDWTGAWEVAEEDLETDYYGEATREGQQEILVLPSDFLAISEPPNETSYDPYRQAYEH